MSLCTHLGMGLNTSFWRSRTQTRQSTCSPAWNPPDLVGEETWAKPQAEFWLQWQRDVKSGWTSRVKGGPGCWNRSIGLD